MSAVLGEVQVISLDRTPKRWAAFEAANAGVVAYRREPAVDGARLDSADLIARGIMTADLAYSAAAAGCALSHAGLWRRAVETDASVTVCEDDVLLRRDFADAANAALASVPDAEFVLWGWNLNSVLAGRLFGETPFAMTFDQGAAARSLDAFRQDRRAPALLRLHRAFGTPCYTITPQGALRLLQACFPLRPGKVHFPLLEREIDNSGIDLAMNLAYPTLQAHVAAPPLALTLNDAEQSTVQAR